MDLYICGNLKFKKRAFRHNQTSNQKTKKSPEDPAKTTHDMLTQADSPKIQNWSGTRHRATFQTGPTKISILSFAAAKRKRIIQCVAF